MFEPRDRSDLHASARVATGLAQSGRADAELSISMLGPRADQMVPTATALHFGQWLGWPDWLREGTSLTGSGPLPPMVSLADDLMIVANIIDNADYLALVERMLTSPRPVMGSLGILSLLPAPQLEEALEALVRAMGAQNPFVLTSLESAGSEVRIAFRPPWPMGPLFRFTAIAGLALIYRAIGTLESPDLGRMTLETQLHGAPEARQLLSHFACRTTKSSGAECLRFPAEWLAIPNPHHDPMLWAIARTKLEALVHDTTGTELVRTIREHIIAALETEQRVPRLKQAAASLGVSTRTIVRVLARHGTSFHTLTEEERRSRALPLIADASIPLSEVARQLGFGDMSSFGRSIRHWFDDTPGNLRRTWAQRPSTGV